MEKPDKDAEQTFCEDATAVQEGVKNFINFWLSKGPVADVIEGARQAVDFASANIPQEAAARYRQEIGGIFTSYEQLRSIPGTGEDVIEELGSYVKGLDLAKLNALLPQTSAGNKVDAYVNGPDCLRVLLEEMGKAKRYIHFSVMLFFNDTSGNKIVEALLDALKRGVKVRLMADFGVTALGYNKNLAVGDLDEVIDKLKEAGGQVINTFKTCYGKEEWPAKRAELASQGVPESSLFLQDYVQKQMTMGVNVVNHRKFMIVDGISAIVGSVNVGDQYLFDTPVLHDSGQAQPDGEAGHGQGVPAREEEWHDGCFRIQGAAALTLNRIFSFQWTVLGGDVFDPEDPFYKPETDLRFGDEECTLYASFPGNPVNVIQQYYLSLLTYAGDETVIVNPYLIDQAFWDELKSLDEQRAKCIALCNPLRVNDHPTNGSAVRSNMYEPFLKGVAFYDYSHTERFSHWKITYDKRSDCVFHGSYNINERSACHDFELGVLVKGKAFADKVKKMIDYDLSVSEKISGPETFFKYPALHPSTYWNKLTQNFT
ncbi:phosphatidylserine/phosphatidylglycerophosphate/cardiolipin synthase family protein [Paenibacillus sp. UNC499MF]|uniref:phospholipase D-like domain-containing protein n=1 Tax=Paenibacillus sp. UNC499MF TaxID=1502751 RepID=UPI0008A01085|nr:phosphatidylserine/phosphatidylglycerophosphate/cardiolipin synthase family protein [Paenibacillus sp. UNC499MF]SEG45989.1 cardiolipin synthase [Paenibacillus sp. UNC499MF]